MNYEALTKTLTGIGLYDVRNNYTLHKETKENNVKKVIYRSEVSDLKFVTVTTDYNKKIFQVGFVIK